MKKLLLGFSVLLAAHVTMAQKPYDLYVVAEGNFGSPNGDVFKASRTGGSTHVFSAGLFQTANSSLGIDVLQDYGTFGNRAVLCGKGGASSPYKLSIVAYPSFDTIKTFTGGAGYQCLGKASNTKGYVSQATGNIIQLIDLVNNTMTPVTDTANMISSYASYMAAANGFMYVAIGSKIVKIDTAANKAVASILPGIGSIAGMQYDAANNCIWLLGKVSGISALVKLEPSNNDLLNAPVSLTGISNAAQLRLAVNKLYFLSGKNVYAYNIASPVVPVPLIYTSTLPGNSFSFAYGKSFDVDPYTGDFAVATAGNYAEPTKYEIVDGTTFTQIDTGSVAGRIGNELELHTYIAPVIDTAALQTVFAQCDTTITAPVATAGSLPIAGTTNDSLNLHNQGSHTITWTFTNGYLSSTATQTVIIDDTIAPVADNNLEALNVNCPYTLTAPTATDNCAGLLMGTTDSLHFTVAGNYTVQWHYDDGHGNTTIQTQQLKVNCTTGIDELSAQQVFQLYPNPTNGFITIRSNLATANKKGYNCIVTNALGQVFYKSDVKEERHTIDLTNMSSGIYLITIADAQTNRKYTQKFIKR
ncbi:T9SS type A sorting domain-containing protein [Taibaiella lutea]|uniref:T9SS type A sorting domain-containing protein n=1 Tax=Taibaiella lutea TaxID=2608001 RepID=A0A5M6CHJ1_9BACT|nr:T9SS type A sorting domain-containing protein [Taibaiella lutea]KAA5534517.1 T9SS type A sorting domain-containing protein [Taibaiella lutea]